MTSSDVLTAEEVAYWYLRLNGFLLLKNFLVHGDRRGAERTEIDVLGVRFPHRSEHLAAPMDDDIWMMQTNSIVVVFCDAKRGANDFNDAWANQDKQVMESFLALIGIIPRKNWESVAQELYKSGFAKVGESILITTLLMNHDPSSKVSRRWPSATCLQLSAALSFIHKRFKQYRAIKTQHGQWAPSGDLIFRLCEQHCETEFVKVALHLIGSA